MDEQTLKQMPEYVQKLPKEVRDFVFDGVWESRTTEIATKYSLNESQTDTFINKVLYILIGLENPDDFLNSTISELNISRLLATQMMEEIEKRVFEYAINEIEKNKVPEASKKTFDANADTEPEIPEVRPEITPMVEGGESVHTNPPPVETPKPEVARTALATPAPKPIPQAPDNLPGVELPSAERPGADVAAAPAAPSPNPASEVEPEKTFIGSDFLQKPVSPEELPPVSDPKSAPEETPPAIPTPPTPPKHTVDPYREPIE